MLRITLVITLIVLGGCTHKGITGKVKNNNLSELGIVIIDYHDEHIKMTVNGDNVIDEEVFSKLGGSGVSVSKIIETTNDLAIEFCVDGECLKRNLSRSKGDIYLSIYRKGPIAIHSPQMELSHELWGFD